MKIFVESPKDETSSSFLTKENIKRINALGEVTWNTTDRHLTPQELREALHDVDVCICGWYVPQFDGYVLEKAEKLKLIAYMGGSVNGVVSEAMYKKGIRIVAGNEAFARSVAEGTMTYILCSQRRVREYEQDMRRDGWGPWPFFTESLLEKTVGLVGFGAVSYHLVEMLKPFSVHIKVFSNHLTSADAEKLGVEKATLEEVFSQCDIVSLHCANSPQNYHLVGEHFLKMMRNGALLVNTSRGTVLDEMALARHVCNGRIRAALDVFEQEPPAMDSPLRSAPTVLLQPHLGGPTTDQRPVAARIVIEDVERFKNGLELKYEVAYARAKTMSE